MYLTVVSTESQSQVVIAAFYISVLPKLPMVSLNKVDLRYRSSDEFSTQMKTSTKAIHWANLRRFSEIQEQGVMFLGNREQGNSWSDCWDQGNSNLLSIIIIPPPMDKWWNKQTSVGKKDKVFGESRLTRQKFLESELKTFFQKNQF